MACVMAARRRTLAAIACCLTSLALATVVAADEVPVVHVAISDEAVHPGTESTLTCRIQNKGTHKLSIEKHVTIEGTNHVDVIATDDTLTTKYEREARIFIRMIDMGRSALYILNMLNVSYKDTGRYVCKLLKTEVKGHANLMVYKQPSSVSFHKFRDGDIITFTAGIGRHVGCTAIQSAPAAHVRISVGNVTVHNVSHTSQRVLPDCWTSDRHHCILHFLYKSIAVLPSLVTQAADDGQVLRCEASLRGVDSVPVETSIDISVLYAPVITCERNHTVYVSDAVQVTCNVSANPAPTAFVWGYSAKSSGVVVSTQSSGYSVEGSHVLYSTNKELAGGLQNEVSLHIPRLQLHLLTTYTLHVSNSEGNTSTRLTLHPAEGVKEAIILKEKKWKEEKAKREQEGEILVELGEMSEGADSEDGFAPNSSERTACAGVLTLLTLLTCALLGGRLA